MTGPNILVRGFRRLPIAVRAVLALAAVALGAVILLRPTTSLWVLVTLIGVGLLLVGVLELAGLGRGRSIDVTMVRASVAILGGAIILLAPGITVRVVAIVVGIALLVGGAMRVVGAFRRGVSLDARVAGIALGAAEAIFGLLALSWPDITLMVVAVVFGAQLIIGGLTVLIRLFRRPRPDSGAHGVLARWTRTIAAVLVLVLAIGAAVVSGTIRGASPVVDAFYAAPRDVPDEPRRLIRSEPFTREVPAGARGWRILYTTTSGTGEPAVAGALVVVPEGVAAPPVIDWAHGTTGVAQQCAPSLLADPFGSGALEVLPEIIAEGWALVATDYIGLGTQGPHPYLIGRDSAHATLDALRAARELDDADLGEQAVVWGHSQGGGAALWAGAVAEEYAPELALDGVAAMAPAANLPGLVASLDEVTGGSVFAAFVAAAYTAVYDDVVMSDYVRPGALVTVRAMAQRCLAEPSTFVSVLALLGLSQDPQLFKRDPGTGPLAVRLQENVPPPTVAAPLLIGQGEADSLITADAQREFVEALCADGQALEYRTYPGLDHLPLVAPTSPAVADLFDWTAARFAGTAVPAAAPCPAIGR